LRRPNSLSSRRSLKSAIRVVPHLQLRNTPIATIPVTAISAAIKSINANFNDGINGFEIEINQFGNCFGTKDFKEGTTAFLEKRKAKF